MTKHPTAEHLRLHQDHTRERNWKRWGPYLSERQWGTVREDYSHDGNAWSYFPHEHARSRAYRWGEDGLFGITDRQCRLCFGIALWNGRDPILKERLFGVTGHEGNHGEDVKECYYYLDSTPTHSYMRGLYKYPQREFPYARLVEENQKRTRDEREFELADTGAFDEDRYFDVQVEYAKAGPEDVLIRVTIANRGPEDAELVVLPQLWFRNTWSWGCTQEGCAVRPWIQKSGDEHVLAEDPSLGRFRFAVDAQGEALEWLFTENVTNARKLYGAENEAEWVKDAFHEYVVNGRGEAVSSKGRGTKCGALLRVKVEAGRERVLRMRLVAEREAPRKLFGRPFEELFSERKQEAWQWYDQHLPARANPEEREVIRQAWAGLFWNKQFYHYVVDAWLEGDPDQPAPPEERRQGRNRDWRHVYNRDVISMPDKWEYPWFAAWDLAFHAIPFARLDPHFAKGQLELFLREWYMHPNGQIPAYEWSFSDVTPPVHAWAVWRVYKKSAKAGERDKRFLASSFQKLLLNFTWWVNRKDSEGNHVFSGGFLGLDNIGVFDRNQPLPTGGQLEQADGTAWMAFYCGTMLSIALELAEDDPSYEDMASKFFEHFVHIVAAMNTLGGTGLWDDEDGFYYDQIQMEGRTQRLRTRSMVGLLPLIAVEVLERERIDRLPGFKKRMEWFLANEPDLARHVTAGEKHGEHHWLLAIPSRDRLERMLRYLLDEEEFLAPHGVRSVSRVHAKEPFVLRVDGREHRVDYTPGESTTALFGGNSNWRGPIWFPVNYLIVEALERYHHFYGDDLKVEYPRGSGRMAALDEVARDLSSRLTRLFLPDAEGHRPAHGRDARYRDDPHWKDLVLFYEYFHGDDGRGLGASHQTGWTALVASLMER
ncbi:MAG: glucosidase [Planctomycetes bacterium]|nr:glucosidase [Planctomycetota bacterium]